jgi:ribosomal protein L7Ae-like RNA K-turn-binding protein
MSVKEIKEAIKGKKILFGIKQTIKNKIKIKSIFIAKDTRDETVEKLEAAKIEFVVLKSKADLAKELNLDFESEIYAIQK